MKFEFNLQLFAEEEEVLEDDEVLEHDEADDDPENLDDGENAESLDDNIKDPDGSDGSEDPDELDAKTKAIIRAKKDAKEAKEKLAKIQKELDEQKQKKEKDRLIDKKIEEGYSEKEAKNIANLEFENKQLKQLVIDNKFAGLEAKYPLISNHKREILKLQKNLPGMTLDEIYLAKFFNGSSKDAEKLAQQRLLYSKNEAESKEIETGETTNMSNKNTKLSPSDERAYKILKETRPDMSRKKFQDMMQSDEIEE